METFIYSDCVVSFVVDSVQLKLYSICLSRTVNRSSLSQAKSKIEKFDSRSDRLQGGRRSGAAVDRKSQSYAESGGTKFPAEERPIADCPCSSLAGISGINLDIILSGVLTLPT